MNNKKTILIIFIAIIIFAGFGFGKEILADPDGDLTFSWSCTGGTLSDPNIAQPTFTAPMVDADTTYTCTLTVTDSYGFNATDSMDVLVKNLTPTLPTAVNLSVDPPNSNDYCGITGYPPVRLRWQFSDPGDSQSAYQIQLDTDSNFSNPRGCPLSTDTEVPTAGQAGPDYSCLAQNLSWNTTYYWRLKVWDSQDTPSTWIYPPSPPGSPTPPSLGTSFDTISHAWPNPNFTFDDRVYSTGEVITFTDDSHCYKPDGTWYRCGTDEYAVTSYLWNFGDETTSSDKSATTTHAYNTADDYTVNLSVTDDLGTCSWANSVQVGVGLPLPEWKEISPF